MSSPIFNPPSPSYSPDSSPVPSKKTGRKLSVCIPLDGSGQNVIYHARTSSSSTHSFSLAPDEVPAYLKAVGVFRQVLEENGVTGSISTEPESLETPPQRTPRAASLHSASGLTPRIEHTNVGTEAADSAADYVAEHFAEHFTDEPSAADYTATETDEKSEAVGYIPDESESQ